MNAQLQTQAKTKPAAPPSFSTVQTGLLQRKCACGGAPGVDGECAACRKKRLQRKAAQQGTPTTAPSIVHDVLRSPGQPLDAATRAYMEPRFGHDFSQVRVHTNHHAAESAQTVNALAYTVGRNVVFNAGQYAPGAATGKRLLAHELVHVVQQSNAATAGAVATISSPDDDAERVADRVGEAIVDGGTHTDVHRSASAPMLLRRVGAVNCPPDVFGAPADPKTAIEAADPLAVSLATQAADALAADAETAKSGIPDSPSVTFQSYQDHFGLPNAAGKGFLNRLTGIVRPSQEIAMSEELGILARRFRLVARLFSGTMNYRCPGDATITLPGCAAGSCGGSFAFSCRGGFTIALCEPFWSQLGSDEAKAAALIHEATHIILGPSGLSAPGEIGETTQRGPGRNFNIAGCYEFIIDDISGVDSFPVCPPVPTPPTFE